MIDEDRAHMGVACSRRWRDHPRRLHADGFVDLEAPPLEWDVESNRVRLAGLRALLGRESGATASSGSQSTATALPSDVHVQIMTMGGGVSAEFHLPGSDTVADLKLKVREALGVPASEQRLAMGADVLDDSHTLVDLNKDEGTMMITMVRFRPHLVLTGAAGTLTLWDLDNGKIARKLFGHNTYISCLAADWTLQKAISGSWDETMRLWDLSSGKTVLEMAHASCVLCVVVDWTGCKAISGSGDHIIRFWDLRDGRLEQELKGHTGAVSCVSADWEAQKMVTGSWDNSLRLWDLTTLETLFEMTGHTAYVCSLCVDWTLQRAITSSNDKTLRTWDIEHGKPLQELWGHESFVPCLDVDWESSQAISGSWDNTLRVWDLKTGETTMVLRGHSNYVGCVAANWSSGRAVSGSGDHTLRLWDLTTGMATKSFVHMFSLNCLMVDWNLLCSLGDVVQPEEMEPPEHPLARRGHGFRGGLRFWPWC